MIETEAKYEMALKSGRGGSLLTDLQHLRLNQKSKTYSTLKAADGQARFVETQDKLVSEIISGNVNVCIEVDDGIEGGCDSEDAVIFSPPTEEESAEGSR